MWAGEVRADAAAAFGPVSGFKETADQRGNLHKNLKKNDLPRNTGIVIIYRLDQVRVESIVIVTKFNLFNFIEKRLLRPRPPPGALQTVRAHVQHVKVAF